MAYTLEQLNAAQADEAARMIAGLYEHSDWIAERALAQRPFTSLAQFKHAMTVVLDPKGSAAEAFRKPGPGTMAQTCGFPVAIAAPIAMYAAPCSCRVCTVRMEASAS